MQATITLTEDQEKALPAVFDFIASPTEQVFVLSGYSGCGKSTLVRVLLDKLDSYQQALQLIDPSTKPMNIRLTATTNKAVENLQRISGTPCETIHRALQLRVETDYKTGNTRLIPAGSHTITNEILIIDEASFIDRGLLDQIFKRTKNCKIIFVGDPAQLAPVKSSTTPVFSSGFGGAALTEVVRQGKDNPIVDLSSAFRNTVNTGQWFSFEPDGYHVQDLSRDDFDEAILAEFSRPGWKYHDSKVLTWTNKAVIEYNRFISRVVKGTPNLEVGDYAICNSYVQGGRTHLKTDQLVEITKLDASSSYFDTPGQNIQVDGYSIWFMPATLDDRKSAIAQAKAKNLTHIVETIENTWIDLRAAYAQTINKSQGSTYDKVFIDLDDLVKCTNGNMLARMLYVAVSRARSHVYFTGDLA